MRSRWIQLDGAVNVRDLGGLGTTDGRVTRFGRVLRSDNLQNLSPGDEELLIERIGLRKVIDLRSHAEVRLEGPGPLTRRTEITIHHLTLFAEAGHYTDVAADTQDPPDPPQAPQAPEIALAGEPALAAHTIDGAKVLPWQTRQETGPKADRSIEHYLGYLQDRPDAIVDALRVMATGGGAALVHCAAGKDRTGVACALVHHVAGVPHEEMLADYLLTNDESRIQRKIVHGADFVERTTGRRPTDEAMRVAASVYPAFLDAFFDSIRAEHGSVDAYAEAVLGVDAELRARIHDRILGPG